MNKLLNLIVRQFDIKIAYAHCDIPCGIYDPYHAQIAVHTVIRMIDLINGLKKGNSEEGKKEFIHNIARYTKVKEEHAEIIKHEIRVIWGDYFKPEHLEKYPELNDLVFKILKLASKVRQEISKEDAVQLLDSVQKFTEIFWQTKGLKTVRIKSPYPTEGEIVLPS